MSLKIPLHYVATKARMRVQLFFCLENERKWLPFKIGIDVILLLHFSCRLSVSMSFEKTLLLLSQTTYAGRRMKQTTNSHKGLKDLMKNEITLLILCSSLPTQSSAWFSLVVQNACPLLWCISRVLDESTTRYIRTNTKSRTKGAATMVMLMTFSVGDTHISQSGMEIAHTLQTSFDRVFILMLHTACKIRKKKHEMHTNV